MWLWLFHILFQLIVQSSVLSCSFFFSFVCSAISERIEHTVVVVAAKSLAVSCCFINSLYWHVRWPLAVAWRHCKGRILENLYLNCKMSVRARSYKRRYILHTNTDKQMHIHRPIHSRFLIVNGTFTANTRECERILEREAHEIAALFMLYQMIWTTAHE